MKKGFFLLVLIAILWWWHVYKKPRKNTMNDLMSKQISVSKEDVRKINAREKDMENKLIQKASAAFAEDYGRQPSGTKELIEKGYISKESVSQSAEK